MAVMKCARITTMKMGPAAVVTITMNTVPSAGMSTAMTKRAAAAKLMLMKNMNMLLAAVKNMSTIISAAVVGKNTTITNKVMMNVAVGMSTTTNISMAKAVAVG